MHYARKMLCLSLKSSGEYFKEFLEILMAAIYGLHPIH